MKNKLLWVLLVFTLILTACQHPTNEPNQESTASSSLSKSTTGETSTTSTSSKASEQAISDPEKQAQEILKSLTETLATALPQKILTANDGQFLSATITQDRSLTVNYYAEDHPIPLNDTQLQSLTAIARFVKTTYATEAEAKEAVNYVPVNTAGQAVDLGHAITGYQDAGAGSVFLSWQEGNWSLSVRGINLEGEDPLPLAKEVVAQLEKASLPAPKTVGQINLQVSNKEGAMGANSLTWQEGNVVYLLEHHEPLQVIEMALSLN